MTLYGYARVSVREPEDKNLDLQVERQKLLAALESPVEKRARVKSAAVKGRTGKAKPFATSLHRMPTATQQARWEAVHKARKQGLSLRAISRTLGIAKNTVKKYMSAESPPTKKLSAKERAKAEALAASLIVADKSG